MRSTLRNTASFLGLLFVLGCLSSTMLPHGALAEQTGQSTSYVLLAPLPLTGGPSGGDDTSVVVGDYVKGMITLIIAVAGGLAVLKIVVSGFQYISTDAFSGKETARTGITDALIGLLLVLSSYVILNTINPKLVHFDFNLAGQQVGSGFSSTTPTFDPNDPAGPISDVPVAPAGIAAYAVSVGCTNSCVASKSDAYFFPQKSPGGKCVPDVTCKDVGCQGATCLVTQALASKLAQLNKDLKSNGIDQNSWKVSEMFPSTVTHTDDCHHRDTAQTGSCVDIVVYNGNDDITMGNFLKTIDSEGFSSWVYESRYRLDDLKRKFPKYASHFASYTTTTSENAHVELH